jgi:hypothetical protein
LLKVPDQANVDSAAFAFYPAKNSRMENNIATLVGDGFKINQKDAPDSSSNDSMLGNIALYAAAGFSPEVNGKSDTCGAQPCAGGVLSGLTFKDNIFAYSSVDDVNYPKSHVVTNIQNSTFYGYTSPIGGSLAFYVAGDDGTTAPISVDSSLILQHPGATMYSVACQPVTLTSTTYDSGNHPNAPELPSGCALLSDASSSADPNGCPGCGQVGLGQGQCLVYIPSSNTNLKGKGTPTPPPNAHPTDIGANVLYAYDGGNLTGRALWNSASGKFTCGAPHYGSSSTPGITCNNVNQYLNVNANGCSLPY